jgi:hypothetical protein
MPFDGTIAIRTPAAESEERLFPPARPVPISPALRMLYEARRLIAAPEHWVRGSYRFAGDSYCAAGALRAVAGRPGSDAALKQARRLLLAIAARHGYSSIEAMNDASSHRQVLAAFDEAIAAAEAARRLPAYLPARSK